MAGDFNDSRPGPAFNGVYMVVRCKPCGVEVVRNVDGWQFCPVCEAGALL